MSTDMGNVTRRGSWNGVRHALTEEFERQTARLTQLTADTGDPGEDRYGVCEKCWKDIPDGRPEILPQARFCVPCQERHGM